MIFKPPLAPDFTQLFERIPLIFLPEIADKLYLFLNHMAEAVYNGLAPVVAAACMHIYYQFICFHKISLFSLSIKNFPHTVYSSRLLYFLK